MSAGRTLRLGRIVDVLAVLAIAFVVYRVVIAPRNLPLSAARPAPHVTFASLDGPPFVLHAHVGRIVFLDFYATWCEPCRVSLPWVERFARNHSDVIVVPVDVGEPAEVARAFAKQYHLTNVALDPDSLSRGFFQLDGFPTMVVVDAKGRIRATWEGLNPAIALNMENASKALASR